MLPASIKNERKDGGEGGNRTRALCVVPRGKAGGGSDGLHPRSKIQVRNKEQVLHSAETDVGGGSDQIYGKAAITAPLTLGYLVLGNLGAAQLKPLSSLFPLSWTRSSDFTQVLNVLLILCEFSGEKQPETEQLL